MAVLSEISVGDVFFYTVDYIPTHTAPRGSVAILYNDSYDTSFIWTNNDGNNTWIKKISPSHGHMFINNNTVGVVADGTQTLGAWYSYTTELYTSGELMDFIKSTDGTFGDSLEYTGGTISRFMVKHNSTMRAGPSKWISWECASAIAFSVPPESNECFGSDNAGTINVGTTKIIEGSNGIGFTIAISPISREAGGNTTSRTYIPKHGQLTVIKIDEGIVTPNTLLSETWESSGFTENSWTVVNDTTNQWVVGQAESNSGTSSAYISSDGGTSATYVKTVSDVSHFYIDINFPSGYDSITMTFDWKAWAENAAGATQYDYGCVVITDTGTTPTSGVEVITTQATGGGNGRVGASTNLGKFNEAYGGSDNNWRTETIDLTDYVGAGNKRLVFTWKDDTSAGDDPPFVVDNILITGDDKIF